MTTDPPKASKSGRWQFSLRTLLVGVAFVAVGCVALVNADILWAICMLTAALAMLFVSLIGCVVLRGQRQAFWSGFALVGWGYFLLVQTSPSLVNHNKLVTTTVLRTIHDAVRGEFVIGSGETETFDVVPEFPGPPVSDRISLSATAGSHISIQNLYGFQESFSQVGHSLWTLILAYLGGLLARYFYSTRADES